MKSLICAFALLLTPFVSQAQQEPATVTIKLTEGQRQALSSLMYDYSNVIESLPTNAFSQVTSYLFDNSQFGRAITTLSKNLMSTYDSRNTDLEFAQLLLVFSVEAGQVRKLTKDQLNIINNALVEELKEQNTGFVEGIFEGGTAMVSGAAVGLFSGIYIVNEMQKRGKLYRANQDEFPAAMIGILAGAVAGKTAQDLFDIFQDDPFRVRVSPYEMSTEQLLQQPAQ